MSVRLRLSPSFSDYTDRHETVQVEGNTVKECLDSLIDLFPIFKTLLFESGDYRLSLIVIYRGQVIVPDQLELPVADNEEILLLPMVQGG